MNPTDHSEYRIEPSALRRGILKLIDWLRYGTSMETKLYFVIFFLFSAAVAGIIYNVAFDTYVTDETQNYKVFRVLRTKQNAENADIRIQEGVNLPNGDENSFR